LANKRAGGITVKLIDIKAAKDMLIFCPFLDLGPVKWLEWLHENVLGKDKVKLLGIIVRKKADCGDYAYLKEFHASALVVKYFYSSLDVLYLFLVI